MADVENLAIVGVGLIGGSIGMAALRRGAARQVIGVGRNAANLRIAERLRAVTASTTELAEGCADADLVVICTPVDTIGRFVREAAAACRKPALISDAGSTKAEIIAALPGELPGGVRFLGGHPLAGGEKGGVEHARADLFAGRTTVLAPTAATLPEDIVRLSDFWNKLGANVRVMPPNEHDRAVAATSHMPHLVAAALALSTEEEVLPLVAAGWLDATRIATMDTEVWQPIFAANREQTLKALDRFESTLQSLRRALEGRQDELMGKLLAEASKRRASVNTSGD